jgi:flavin-dependent dehydrogenase
LKKEDHLNSTLNALPENGRVVIIGGGPGGAACAMALDCLSAEMGRKIQIIVLEGKQFNDERQYNQCVGVLSPPLNSLMEEDLHLPFPYHLVLNEIHGYVLYSSSDQIKLVGDDEASYATRRIHFDAYMLEAVKQRNITVMPVRAVDLEFHPDCVVVYTEHHSLEADVVVGAFGLDEGSGAIFSRLTPYKPPRELKSIVTKYHPGPEAMAEYGHYIHAFLPSHPLIEFGAISPKGDHLTINIAGDSVDAPLMHTFLNMPEVNAVLPDWDKFIPSNNNNLHFFKGRFPCSLARGYYGDRYVMVGDAAGLVRAFKGKGVTHAVMTGIRAAETILKHGVSEQAFHGYYRTANNDIIKDLPYGQAIRMITKFLSWSGLLNPVVRAAHHSPDLASALFGAVSAHVPYYDVVKKSLRPKTIWATVRAFLKII